ncbi:MAG: hypothetical protein Q4A09_02275 [Capnocytophaga felis]|nr:hypothetical protein [Capnocytophaga felis]
MLVTLSFGSVFFDDFGRGNAFFEVMNGFALTQIGIFVSIGAVLLVWGVTTFFQNGGHFIGTPTRLIHCKRGTIKTYVWELFTDEIKTDIDSGNIRFTPKTGNFQGTKTPVFVPDKIEIISAENVSKIEKVARERIYSLSHLTK